MLIIHTLRWALIVAEALIALPVLYLCVLSLSALLATQRRKVAWIKDEDVPSTERARFVVLIPAHNEEKVLGKLLGSLASLDYPTDRYTVCLVADNCTDKTAEIARTIGWVQVYERFDTLKRGKGYALNWAFQQFEREQLDYDACVVLDADSIVAPTFLRAMEWELARGAQALQAYNGVLNSANSPSTALRWIALALVNHVRPLGRNGLGSSATLTGNGMCLRHTLLQRFPWQAFALGEDYQYYLTLMLHGERVRYVPEAIVRSQMPVTFAQMRTQDVRWESAAENQPGWRTALDLVRAGLKNRDLVRFEAAAELLTPPLSLIVGWYGLTFLAAISLWWLPGVLFSLMLLVGLLIYSSAPLYLLKPPRAVYFSLVYAPGFIVWKLWVYFVLKRRKKYTGEWVRTSRIAS